MSVVFTSPGKLGDAVLQWPVAYTYAKQKGIKIGLWLDEKTCKPLVPLFQAQPCVEFVELKAGIQNYTCGGQPWDFGLKTADHLEHEIYHLGFRQFPQRQISLETAACVPLGVTLDPEECSLFVPEPQPPVNRLVLHGLFTTHTGGTPGFWKFLNLHAAEFEEMFDELVFVGKPEEVTRALDLYSSRHSKWGAFYDQGNFLEVAKLLQPARAVIGCGSCVAALASVMKVPCIRVHDPIGEAPKMIWNGLGKNQLNETEISLRKLWPAWRDEWLMAKAEVASG